MSVWMVGSQFRSLAKRVVVREVGSVGGRLPFHWAEELPPYDQSAAELRLIGGPADGGASEWVIIKEQLRPDVGGPPLGDGQRFFSSGGGSGGDGGEHQRQVPDLFCCVIRKG